MVSTVDVLATMDMHASTRRQSSSVQSASCSCLIRTVPLDPVVHDNMQAFAGHMILRVCDLLYPCLAGWASASAQFDKHSCRSQAGRCAHCNHGGAQHHTAAGEPP